MKPPATMVSRMLDAADLLLDRKPKSAAFRRRAVSSAYYAMFHALAKSCTECLLPGTNPGSDEYIRVYRALNHKPLRDAFRLSPLKEALALRSIGTILAELQSAREDADYSPPGNHLFPLASARDLVAKARRAVSDLDKLTEEERRALATCLLFKVRS